jgi:hypothetical protein
MLLRNKFFPVVIASAAVLSAAPVFAKSDLVKSNLVVSNTKSDTIASCQATHHPVFDFGVGEMYLNDPKINAPTTLSTGGTSVGTFTNSGWTPAFNIGVGYWVYNASDSWLTKLFGREETTEVIGNFYTRGSATHKNLSSSGQLWYINGDGSVYGGAGGNTDTTRPFHNFQASMNDTYGNVGLYFKGKNYTRYPSLTLNPRIGILYSDRDQSYKYTLDYNFSPDGTGDNVTDHHEYSLDTKYFGAGVGDRLNYLLFQKRMNLFVDAEAQLLRVKADLDAYQKAASEIDSSVRTVKSSVTKNFSGRGLLLAGAEYNFSKKSDGATIGLQGGADYWQYSPSVETTTQAGKSVGINMDSQVNPFVALKVYVPFG